MCFVYSDQLGHGDRLRGRDCADDPLGSRRTSRGHVDLGSFSRRQDGRDLYARNDGSERSVTFTAQGEREGSFVFHRPGAEPIAGSFSIAYEDAPGNDFISVSVGVPYLTPHAWIAAGLDSLRLDGVFEGGFNSTYARVRP